MNILYLLLFCVVGFGAYLLIPKRYRSSILYTLAIGSIVNANVFNAVAFPIQIGSFHFGINSVVYMLFLFCVLMMYVYYGKKETVTLVVCSIGAIVFAAFIELLSGIASVGYSSALGLKMVQYLASCLGSIAACVCIVLLYNAFRRVRMNLFLNVALSLLLTSVVESLIFYGITYPCHLVGDVNRFWWDFLALYLGKLIGIAFSLITTLIVKYALKKDDVPYPLPEKSAKPIEPPVAE